ncbi:YfjI family protein [Salipiger aestuarii]|uniref:YfjI family protein n=1 Tax=Salipiger aestuarii TaxID=568098 RepID=UPI001CC2F1A4|nr:YfjI family protein [Salipiger aestuarii]
MTLPEPIPFRPDDHWPDPDMRFAEPQRPPAPVMSPDDFAEVFGPWAGWLTCAAEVKGAPVDYVALALLTTASAAIGNARWFSPWNGWKEPPVLWAMLVGEPSAGKSPALDAVADPVKDIERALSQDYQSARQAWKDKDEIASLALAQWKADAKKALAEGQDAPAKPDAADAGAPPIRERLTITDATTEKVAELLAQTWRGLLLSRDELSGWLASMDRYSGGGDRPFWLEAYGGRSYPVDRKSSPEPIIVDHLSVAVLGGTQPDKLARLLVNTDDDGLLARFLTVFPEPVPLSRPRAQIDVGALRAALERLRSLGPWMEDGIKRPFVIAFTEPAADALQAFRGQCRAWETEAAGLFKGHIGKLPGLAVRVAGVLAHLDWAAMEGAPYPDKIDAGHIRRACLLVGEHLRLHAFRAYGAATPPEDIGNARRIADVIRREGWQSFTARDIQRRGLAGLQLAKPVGAALDVLEQADWLMRYREDTGGKPKTTYAVNPKTGAAS